MRVHAVPERVRAEERATRQRRVYERANARMVVLGATEDPDLLPMLGLEPGQQPFEVGRISTGFVSTSKRPS